MQFSILKVAVAALAICSDAVLGQVTPAQVVKNVEMITEKSQAIIAPAQSVTILNGPLVIVGLGPLPKVIAGFADIVATAGVAITQMKGMAPVPAGAESDAIFEAVRSFVTVHQKLLNVLIGKAGLFSTVPLIGAPIATVLRQVESVVDTIAFALIDAVESRAQDLEAQFNSLSETLDTTVGSFGGIKLD